LEEVKRRSQEALLKRSDPAVEKLKMIDTIQQLGISHHLEEEINTLLERLRDFDASNDLFAAALQFRLLRQNSCPTSSSSGTFDLFYYSARFNLSACGISIDLVLLIDLRCIQEIFRQEWELQGIPHKGHMGNVKLV
jgi:hypothetical protein